ncbi:nuclear transport factor 2 family protein [Streptomyces sp. A3M-1-3]|uniref:YybH family protein n=1 Tax=Streptomyces sp. A3M-1-3 TaxID=2962044 RepID=UPI0020B6D608|nr:nuclear transport factor 2 family protein [Streptomyces sp. A3M-1-3]MCP3822753.1 nuclear transport factor 2 family protein [Streptomyces sp. A3M-1-3]
MSLTVDIDIDNPDLTADTDIQNEIFLQVFNSGDGDLFDRLYLEDSISNFSGEPLTGEKRRQFFKDFLAPKPHLVAEVTHSYVAGDVALIGVKFTIDGTGPDGEPLHIAGNCTDVLRRLEDGRWLMSIDRPVAGSLLDS